MSLSQLKGLLNIFFYFSSHSFSSLPYGPWNNSNSCEQRDATLEYLLSRLKSSTQICSCFNQAVLPAISLCIAVHLRPKGIQARLIESFGLTNDQHESHQMCLQLPLLRQIYLLCTRHLCSLSLCHIRDLPPNGIFRVKLPPVIRCVSDGRQLRERARIKKPVCVASL